MVQDLCLITEAVIPVYLLVADAYKVLSRIPGYTHCVLGLDLKDSFFLISLHPDLNDAFFFISIHPDSHLLFVFEWENPILRENTAVYCTWTVLTQGVRGSLHLFCNNEKTFRDLDLKQGITVQAIDDILILSPTWELFNHNSIYTLNNLAKKCYNSSNKKDHVFF